jgi:hypothetical protein
MPSKQQGCSILLLDIFWTPDSHVTNGLPYGMTQCHRRGTSEVDDAKPSREEIVSLLLGGRIDFRLWNRHPKRQQNGNDKERHFAFPSGLPLSIAVVSTRGEPKNWTERRTCLGIADFFLLALFLSCKQTYNSHQWKTCLHSWCNIPHVHCFLMVYCTHPSEIQTVRNLPLYSPSTSSIAYFLYSSPFFTAPQWRPTYRVPVRGSWGAQSQIKC